jgi:hypothetical protein
MYNMQKVYGDNTLTSIWKEHMIKCGIVYEIIYKIVYRTIYGIIYMIVYMTKPSIAIFPTKSLQLHSNVNITKFLIITKTLTTKNMIKKNLECKANRQMKTSTNLLQKVRATTFKPLI